MLFDLPGVGKSQLRGNVTSDQKADDVDAILDDAARTYSISTKQVDPVGWSLGTADALKYVLLAPKANRSRTIHNVILIATKPGGNTDGVVDGNQAQCVSTMLDGLKSVSGRDRLFAMRLEKYAFELIFPYRNQRPYHGVDSGCTATLNPDKGEVTLHVETTCVSDAECRRALVEQVLNQKAWPWSLTDGVPAELYANSASKTWTTASATAQVPLRISSLRIANVRESRRCRKPTAGSAKMMFESAE